LVSALVIFNDPGRVENLRQAVACFAQQSWPYKECLIINGTCLKLPSAPDVRVINVKARYLGEYKNLALYNATGEWCFPWPDDCEVAPDYISFHMHRRSRSHPTVISNPLGAVVKDGIVRTVDWETAPFSSFQRFGPHTYDQDGSEVRFLNKFFDKNLVQAESGLATRFFSDYASS
jgi:hypothetical protein